MSYLNLKKTRLYHYSVNYYIRIMKNLDLKCTLSYNKQNIKTILGY